MFHPQPASTLMLNPNYAARALRHDDPGPLLGLLVDLREIRKPADASIDPAPAPVTSEAAGSLAHGGGQSPRVRSGLGGRILQARRRHGARAVRRRGDRHIPGRRADRRGR